MAVRTAYVGTQVAGDVLTAANFSKVPGGWLGYATSTSGQSGITSETDLTDLSLAVTVNADRLLKITLHISLTTSGGGATAVVAIKEGATYLGSAETNIDATPMGMSVVAIVVDPSTGAHTYKATVQRNGGAGTIGTDVGANIPSLLLVEDIGPAS